MIRTCTMYFLLSSWLNTQALNKNQSAEKATEAQPCLIVLRLTTRGDGTLEPSVIAFLPLSVGVTSPFEPSPRHYVSAGLY